MTSTTTATGLDWEAAARAGMHEIAIDILLILARESECPDDTMSPKDVAHELDKPLGVVAYHCRMLKGRGLIELARTEPRRGALCHFYRLTDLAVA